MVIDETKLNELRIKYFEKLDDFYLTLNPYDYSNSIWDDINDNIKLAKEKISDINTDDPLAFEKYYEEILSELKNYIKNLNSLKSNTLTSREIFLKNVRQISEKIGSSVKSVWNKIKFLFAIPGCVLASFIFAFAFTLIFNTFINWMFPVAYSDEYYGIVEAIVAAIIFLVIRIEIFKDVYLNQPEVEIKTYLIKHAIANLFWWLIFYIIRYKEAVCVYDFSYFEWAMFLPYLCIGGITHEYFISCIIAYFILNYIPLIIAIIYIYYMEKTYDLRLAIQERLDKEEEEKKKKDLVYDDSYEYHFVYKDEYGVSENEDESNNKNKIKIKNKNKGN